MPHHEPIAAEAAPTEDFVMTTLKFPFAALVAMSVLAACSRHEEAAPPPIAPPEVHGEVLQFKPDSPQLKVLQVAPAQGASERVLELPGRVAWDETRTARLVAPLAGRVQRLAVQAGDTVKAGQLLAQLSAPDFGQAQADAARAEADVQQADKSLARARELLDAGAIAARELEAAQADAQRAQAEAARTRARLAAWGGGHAVDQQYGLKSPLNGVVVERNALLGQELRGDGGGDALFVVTDPSRVWVLFDVPESEAARVRRGQTIEVRVEGGAPRNATLEQVADALDVQRRALRIRASLPNTDRALKGEMFVRGLLHLPADASQPVVPADAALLIRGRYVVFVQTAEGRFERRSVKALEAGPGQVRVLEGLKPGERVVVQGALLLQQALSVASPGAGA
jgi:cobalt-zinc-cadmium efflux system membrane fusion protein